MNVFLFSLGLEEIIVLSIFQAVLVCHITRFTRTNDLPIAYQYSFVAILLHRIHAVCDQDDRFRWIFLHTLEESIALLLKCSITDR